MKFGLILSFFLLIVFGVCKTDINSKIEWLYNRLQSRLWTHDQPFRNPRAPQHIKGLYQSHIHINFIDKKNSYFSTLLRKSSLDDNNMFVTSFVLYSLIETAELQTIKLNDHYISMSLETLATFRDKNTPQGVPQYNFWPQNLVNGTWIAQPTNLLNVANMIPSNLPKPIMLVFEKLGLDIILAMKDLVNVFTIPADNDDSGVNLALLGLLKETKSSHFDFWKSFNFNIEDYYRRVLKYAYRPFDSNFSANKFADQIDPRIYYLYHDFFAQKKAQADKNNQTASLILPTTWLINYEEQINGEIRMPFSNNNVDATVCANVLFGISYLALNGELNISKIAQIQQLIRDTADLLAYVIQQKISQRPDLALVYYPSKYDFFWFVSRIINLYKRQQSLPEPFNSIYQTLSKAMKTKGTEFLLKNGQFQTNGAMYWAEFLGNYGKKNRNEDAIFSTSLALNALLDTWTSRKGKSIKYDSDMPQEVHQAIKSGINYLDSHLKQNMKEYNSFFSGSMKSDQTDPYVYPANIHVDKNNKNVDPNTGTFADVHPGMNYVMKGFINPDQYKKMLEQKWFGESVPTDFKGFNQSPFPYWSAEPITEVIALSVLSKFMIAQKTLVSYKLEHQNEKGTKYQAKYD